MNEIDHIKKLDAAAGDAPEVNVADNVIRRIRTQQRSNAESRPLWMAALLSSLAAAVIAFVAIQSFAGLQDPLGDLFTPVWTTFQ